jgi:hypothetical protein
MLAVQKLKLGEHAVLEFAGTSLSYWCGYLRFWTRMGMS